MAHARTDDATADLCGRARRWASVGSPCTAACPGTCLTACHAGGRWAGRACRIQNPESRIRNPEPLHRSAGRKIQNPESGIQSPSLLHRQGRRILDLGFWALGIHPCRPPGVWILDSGFWILQNPSVRTLWTLDSGFGFWILPHIKSRIQNPESGAQTQSTSSRRIYLGFIWLVHTSPALRIQDTPHLVQIACRATWIIVWILNLDSGWCLHTSLNPSEC